MFVKANYKLTKEAIGDSEQPAKHLSIMHQLREKWRKLKPSEKHVYATMAAQDCQRYQQDYKECINRIIDEALEL